MGEKSKKFKFSGREFELVDLPGLYSLETYSEEEEIAKQCLERHQDSVVVNICDANHLERNLLLTLELEKMGIRPIVVVNMSNERKNNDYDKLSQRTSSRRGMKPREGYMAKLAAVKMEIGQALFERDNKRTLECKRMFIRRGFCAWYNLWSVSCFFRNSFIKNEKIL